MSCTKWLCNKERGFVVSVFRKIDFLQLVSDFSPCYDPCEDKIRIVVHATEPNLGRNSFLPVVDARFEKFGNMTYFSMKFSSRKGRQIFDRILSSFLILLQIILLAALFIMGISKHVNIIGLSFKTAFMPIFMLIGLRLSLRCMDQIFIEFVQKMVLKQFRENGIIIRAVHNFDEW